MARAADANMILQPASHDVECASTGMVRRCYSKKKQGKGGEVDFKARAKEPGKQTRHSNEKFGLLDYYREENPNLPE
jgi:hypothetical protein